MLSHHVAPYLPLRKLIALLKAMLYNAFFNSGFSLQTERLTFDLVAVWDCESLCPAATVPPAIS